MGGRRPVGAVLVAAGLALAASACSAGNQSAAMQAPAQVSGVVTSRPPCLPGRACSFLVALVPGALVVASGKDGVHEVHADGHGHYRLFLLEGVWTLQAARTDSAAMGPAARAVLTAGQPRTISLQVHT